MRPDKPPGSVGGRKMNIDNKIVHHLMFVMLFADQKLSRLSSWNMAIQNTWYKEIAIGWGG